MSTKKAPSKFTRFINSFTGRRRSARLNPKMTVARNPMHRTKKSFLDCYKFRNPAKSRTLGSGRDKTVWCEPDGNGSRVIVNSNTSQNPIKEKTQDDFKFTQMIYAEYGFFSVVTKIPQIKDKKLNKFVYFAEMAQKIPFKTREDGVFYLDQVFNIIARLRTPVNGMITALVDIKPENFGIVERGGTSTVIVIDIDTGEIIKVPVSFEAKHNHFFYKYQQYMVLATFFLHTTCPDKEELCEEYARRHCLSQTGLDEIIGYKIPSKEGDEIVRLNMSYLDSIKLTHSSINYNEYYSEAPFHLTQYLREPDLTEFRNVLPRGNRGCAIS